MKKPPFNSDENSEFSPESRRGEGFPPDFGIPASIPEACILFCDVVISGKDAAAALKFDEINMFAPMIVMLQKNASAEALVKAAGNLGVPVVKNAMLAKNLTSYGKIGETIPEASYRDVSLVFSRIGSGNLRRRPRGLTAPRRVLPVKVKRPLALEMGSSLFALTGEEPGRKKLLAEPLNGVRKSLIRLLGFTLPPVRVSLNPKLRDEEYRILFKGLEAGRGKLDLCWYAGKDSKLSKAGFPDIMNIPGNLSAAAKAASSVLLRHFLEIIQRRAPELLGRDEVDAILEAAEEKYPVVTGEVKSLLPLGIIREIFQTLVSERVSIRHIAVILETLADWGSLGPAPSELIVDQIRQSLKRQICLEYADDGLTLRVLTLEPKLEQGFADRPPLGAADTQWRGTSGDTASAFMGDDWVDTLSSAVHLMEAKGIPPVILCSPRARFPVKEATRRKLPELAVLSYLEIPPDINVESIGEIQFEGNLRFPGIAGE